MSDRIADGDDHVRAAGDDLASKVGIGRGAPASGIPLDGEVWSLDVAQPAQFLEKCPKNRSCGVVNISDRLRGYDRDPVLLC